MVITTNVSNKFALICGRNYVVKASPTAGGSFGGGTLELSLGDLLPNGAMNNEMPMPDGYDEITSSTAFEFRAPCSILQVTLGGGTSPSINFECILCSP